MNHYLNMISETNIDERNIIMDSLQNDIEKSKIMATYTYEYSLACCNDSLVFIESDMENSQSQNNAGKKGNILTNTITKICSVIYRVISSLIEALSNLFSKKENITTNDYINSNSGAIRYDQDIQKVNDSIDKDIRKGCWLLQKVNSVAGNILPESTIDEWLTTACEKIEKIGPSVIEAKASKIVKNVILKSLDKNKNDVQNAENSNKENSGNNKKEQQKIKIY